MISSVIKIIEHRLFKISTTFVIVLLLGWGISSVADDDIKSASNNFSAMGLVSEISVNTLSIKDAKGSDKSNDTTYNLNIDNLEKIQTNKNIPLNFTDIKEGDQIIVQGLTNGSTFFIKRIISFTSIATLVATTTEDILATTTATTTNNEIATTTEGETTAGVDVDENSTSSSEVATSTMFDETVDENATSTVSTVSTIIDTVVETVKEFLENIVETVIGDTSTSTSEVLDTSETLSTSTIVSEPTEENTPQNIQDIPLQQIIENTEIVNTEIIE